MGRENKINAYLGDDDTPEAVSKEDNRPLSFLEKVKFLWY